MCKLVEETSSLVVVVEAISELEEVLVDEDVV